MAKTKNKIPEGKLLKALAELEDSVEKGDALEDADPEGAFATEGTPLSDAAPSGRGETRKSRGASSSRSSASSSDDASSTAKAFSASDMASSADDASSKKKRSKKTAKAFPPKAKDSASSSDDDDSSSADHSSDGDDDSSSTEKSFREAVEQDETISKAIEVSDFLEALVDQVSLTMLKVVDGFQKSIVAMESRLNARIDNRVSKGIALSQDFNARLAKAISAIGTSVEEQSDIVKSFSNQPAQPRGRAVLSKGEVNQPPWGGQGGGSHMADGSADFGELVNLDKDKVGDWLFAKSSRNQIDPRLILAWEANHYDVTTLPEEIQKSLANDLLK